MAAPDSKSDDKSNRLPFEPSSSRPKSSKKPATTTPAKQSPVKQPSSKRQTDATASIPEVVSRRMARRMAFFCGVPSFLGMMTFIGSYVLIQNYGVEIPPVVTLGVSLGFFALGFVGLSYGLFSASWDEARVGGILGFTELKSNWSKMREAKQSQQNDS
jgi:hypothetical protein